MKQVAAVLAIAMLCVAPAAAQVGGETQTCLEQARAAAQKIGGDQARLDLGGSAIEFQRTLDDTGAWVWSAIVNARVDAVDPTSGERAPWVRCQHVRLPGDEIAALPAAVNTVLTRLLRCAVGVTSACYAPAPVPTPTPVP